MSIVTIDLNTGETTDNNIEREETGGETGAKDIWDRLTTSRPDPRTLVKQLQIIRSTL